MMRSRTANSHLYNIVVSQFFYARHCERSEAILLSIRDCFVPRNDALKENSN